MRLPKMTAMLDLQKSRGLEIGALTNPLITRAMGNISYVDHATTEELRAKYADHQLVDKSRIVDVDYVWGAQTLREATAGATFDYVVASHVVEHVPDLIGWLNEVHTVLRPGGILSLAVPDKRFCVDVYRNPSNLADVLDAHMRGIRRPSVRQIADARYGAMHKPNGALAWNDSVPGEPCPIHDIDHVLGVARDSEVGGQYVDVHCWVFTPESMLLLLAVLTRSGLIHFAPASFHPTAPQDAEFFIALEALERTDDAQLLEQRVARFTALGAPDINLRDWRSLDTLPTNVPRTQALEARIAELEHALFLTHASTSWRVTAPLRRLRTAVLSRLK